MRQLGQQIPGEEKLHQNKGSLFEDRNTKKSPHCCSSKREIKLFLKLGDCSLPLSHSSFVTQIMFRPGAAPTCIKLNYLHSKRVVKKEGLGNATYLAYLTSSDITVQRVVSVAEADAENLPPPGAGAASSAWSYDQAPAPC